MSQQGQEKGTKIVDDNDDDDDDDDDEEEEEMEEEEDETPLNREEIAKALLLVGKAYSMNMVTPGQRSRIKVICPVHHYLIIELSKSDTYDIFHTG